MTTNQIDEAPATAAIYMRVSSRPRPKDQERQTLENQDLRLEDYIKFKRYNIYAPDPPLPGSDEDTKGAYWDKMSGRTADRPGLQRLLEDARLHKFDVVVALRLDRLSRSLTDLKMTTNILRESSVGLEIPDSGIYIDKGWHSPVGNMLIGILGTIAEFEDDLIGERIADAVERMEKENEERRRNGQTELKWGRPKWHQTKNPDPKRPGEFLNDPEKVKLAKEVLALRTRHASFNEIAQRTGIARGTIQMIIKNWSFYQDLQP